MHNHIRFTATVERFPGKDGWHHVSVPKKYTKELEKQRKAWGMYPITATVGDTSWNTKLMMKKGGNFFIALKATVRKKEDIQKGIRIPVSFTLL